MHPLVSHLVKTNYLKSPHIIRAFQKIDRADFVLSEYKDQADINKPLSIGHGQTISQPATVAFMLELLQPKAGHKILDIGSGSGWQTALLAQIVGKKGRVYAVEIIPELKKFGESNLSKYNFIKKGQVKILCQDASSGLSKASPYDRIIAAAAGRNLPQAWLEQLKIGGCLVAPVGHEIILVERQAQDKFKEERHWGFSFVPLV